MPEGKQFPLGGEGAAPRDPRPQPFTSEFAAAVTARGAT